MKWSKDQGFQVGQVLSNGKERKIQRYVKSQISAWHFGLTKLFGTSTISNHQQLQLRRLCQRNLSIRVRIEEHYSLSIRNVLSRQKKINIGKGTEGIKTSIYDKREVFDFKVVNFPYLDRNVRRNPAYGIYISQLVRCARICGDKREFKTRNKRLSTKLEKQGFKKKILEKAFVKFYRSHYDEVRKYGASIKELGVP